MLQQMHRVDLDVEVCGKIDGSRLSGHQNIDSQRIDHSTIV